MNRKNPALIAILVLAVISLACQATSLLSGEAEQPTPTPIPGWVKFEAPSIEIWLPGTYEGGDLANDLEAIVGKLRALGPDFETMADTIEQNPGVFVLWAFDSEGGGAGFLTNVNITKEQVMSVLSLDTYVEAVEKQLPSSFTISERENVQLGEYESVRLVVDMDISGATAKELIYIVKDDNMIWSITFATGVDEFRERLPVFELSISTFRILP